MSESATGRPVVRSMIVGIVQGMGTVVLLTTLPRAVDAGPGGEVSGVRMVWFVVLVLAGYSAGVLTSAFAREYTGESALSWALSGTGLATVGAATAILFARTHRSRRRVPDTGDTPVGTADSGRYDLRDIARVTAGAIIGAAAGLVLGTAAVAVGATLTGAALLAEHP